MFKVIVVRVIGNINLFKNVLEKNDAQALNDFWFIDRKKAVMAHAGFF